MLTISQRQKRKISKMPTTDRKNIFVNIDWLMVILFFALVFAGWMNIFAASYNDAHLSVFDLEKNYGKQILWICTSVLIILIILLIDVKFYSAFSYLSYVLMMVLLAGVLVIGKKVSGARSWYQFGGFALQPSEFVKFAVNLAIAKYLSSRNVYIEKFSTKAVVAAILAGPIFLIMLQPDAGSALVYFAFVFVLYREGGLPASIFILGIIILILFSFTLVSNKFIVVGVLAAITLLMFIFIRKKRKEIVTLISIFILASAFVLSIDYGFNHMLAPHQRQRINVLYGKDIDLKGVGYNVNQSKIAIGSGGFAGKGFLQGTQTKYDFVPEQTTDFIFCTIGEEWGFIGSSAIIILFICLLIRIIHSAERQRSEFSRIYGYGVASILFVHFTINIGMTIGLVPVIGIPLPFFSYGGSSLWGFSILLFIFVKLDAHRLQII